MAHPYKQHSDAERSRAKKLFGGVKPTRSLDQIKNPADSGSYKRHAAAEVSVQGGAAKQRLDRFARGGTVRRGHSDVKEDKALIKGMVKPEALKRADGGQVKKPYGQQPQASPLEREKAKAAARSVGSATNYSAEDRSKLKEMSGGKFARGGRTKARGGNKTNINIVIAKDKGKEGPDAGGLPMPPLGGPPAPPMGGPPGMPPGMPPGGPVGMPGMPPKPFKRGGVIKRAAGGHVVSNVSGAPIGRRGPFLEKRGEWEAGEERRDRRDKLHGKGAPLPDRVGEYPFESKGLKRGGSVKPRGGAESGVGRLEKAKAQKRR